MKHIVLLLALVALVAMILAETASAQSYDYCWAYDDYYYSWYWYYC